MNEINNNSNNIPNEEIRRDVLELTRRGLLFENIPGMRTQAGLIEPKKSNDPKETLRRFLTRNIQ